MSDFNPSRGTNDYCPKDVDLRNYIRQTISQTYRSFGFVEIQTPTFEEIKLLQNSDGGDNVKLIFNIAKRGEKLDFENAPKNIFDICDLALKYDLTVPLARFYANNRNNLPTPFKVFQIDNSYRAERPQRGRFREFTQCDVDILGEDTLLGEIEVINTGCNAIKNLGFPDILVKINDRRILNELIAAKGIKNEQIHDVCIILDKYDKIGFDGVQSELTEILNESQVASLVCDLKKIKEQGIKALKDCGVSEATYSNLVEIIKQLNILNEGKYTVEFDISIVRGQGYYTGTIYEVYMDGMASACGGGGRYDNMLNKICGCPVSAVGFSVGFEKIFTLLKEKQFIPNKREQIAVLFEKGTELSQVLKMQKEMQENYNVLIAMKAKNVTNQLLKLKENGFTKFCFYGDKILNEIN